MMPSKPMHISLSEFIFSTSSNDFDDMDIGSSCNNVDVCPELSGPCLTIDSTKRDYTRVDRFQLAQYVNTYLASRRKEIKRFLLRWFCPVKRYYVADERCLVEMWISKVLDSNFNLQQLVLDIEWPESRLKPFILPLNNTLKYLELDLDGDHLKLPYVNPDMISLETLSLNWVLIHNNDNLGEWISQSCKRLKTLVLNHPSGIRSLEIKSECLEHLTFNRCDCMSEDPPDHWFGVDDRLVDIHISAPNLKHLTMTLQIICPDKHSIKLYAPNLQVLEWTVHPIDHCDIGVLNCLKTVTFSFPYPLLLHPYPMLPISYSNLSNVLQSIQTAESLTLNSLFLEILFLKEQEDGSCGSIVFGNLEMFTVELFSLNNVNILIPVINSFLRRAPNLKRISTSNYGGMESKYGISKFPTFQNLTIQEFKNLIAQTPRLNKRSFRALELSVQRHPQV